MANAKLISSAFWLILIGVSFAAGGGNQKVAHGITAAGLLLLLASTFKRRIR